MDSSARFVRIQNEDYIAIQLHGQSNTAERQPVHLLFVIDVSDSMSDMEAKTQITKLDHVKQSMLFLLPLLQPSDSISLITFGDDSEILLQAQAATEEGKEMIRRKIESLKTDGCTNMSAGLLDMREVLLATRTHQKPGALLLTDGMANLGITNTYQLSSLVETILAEKPDFTLTTVGYGAHHNSDLLRYLATTGSGSYNVVYSREAVATTFGEVFGGLTSVVAQNVSLQLPSSTTPLTHYVYNETTKQIRIGDIYAENDIILLIKPDRGGGSSSSEPFSFQVKGVSLPSLTIFQNSFAPSQSLEDVPKEILLAYYRYHVSGILKAMAETNQHEDIRGKAIALQEQLQALPFTEDILVQMMLDDIENLLTDIRHPFTGVASRNTTYAQHAAYLSLGRGLRSDITEEYEEVESVGPRSHFARFDTLSPTNISHDPESEQPPLTPLQRTRSNALNSVASPFSNRVQLMATTSMRAASRRTD